MNDSSGKEGILELVLLNIQWSKKRICHKISVSMWTKWGGIYPQRLTCAMSLGLFLAEQWIWQLRKSELLWIPTALHRDAVMQVAVLPWRHHPWPSSSPLRAHSVYSSRCRINYLCAWWADSLLACGCFYNKAKTPNGSPAAILSPYDTDFSQYLDGTMFSSTSTPLFTCQDHFFLFFLPGNLLLRAFRWSIFKRAPFLTSTPRSTMPGTLVITEEQLDHSLFCLL